MLGRHQGTIRFTIGQRRGLDIGGAAEPLYVVALEPEAKRVVVGPRAALARDRVVVGELNWLGEGAPSPGGERVEVKLRSAQAAVPATLFPQAGGEAAIVLDEAQFGLAPGQAAVCYRGDRVLGGGWIVAAERGRAEAA